MIGNYGHLFYGQIHDSREARGYHKKNAKTALKTRLVATDAVERQSMKQTENDTDTSPSALRERDRSMADGSTMELTQRQVEGKRSRGDAPVTAMEVAPAAAQAHAQLWSPEL